MPATYISRADALALIVEEQSREILQAAQTSSVAMQTFRNVNMGSSSLRMALLETFPTAQWLTAVPPDDPDIVPKPTTEMSWTTKSIVAEEAATIVLIPENVIDDASIDLWSEVETRSAEAISRLIDQTCFFGTAPQGGIPGSFPVGGLVGAAIAAGNTHAQAATGEDLALAWSNTMAMVEEDGFDVGHAWSDTAVKVGLRNMRDANGQPLYTSGVQGSAVVSSVYGVPIDFLGLGLWDRTKAQALMGDPSLAILGVRQRLTAKPLSEATVGGINLAEQDMVGLRLKIRLGFTVIVPKAPGQAAGAFPFAVLAPKVVGP